MSKKTDVFDCAIIGAGASGMMAAVSAARLGAHVLLLEHANKPGRKLLATGNGKCNFTNAYMDRSCYHGNESLFAILDRFPAEQTLTFFHEIGIYPKAKNGYYYPASEQAASVVNALTKELDRLRVTICTEVSISGVTEPSGKYGRFSVQTDGGTYKSRTLIFATGLLAAPKLGSDGSAFDLIKGFGHHFTPIVPALCGFYAKGLDFKTSSGVRCEATVTVFSNDVKTAFDTGEVQFADYGISGIPVFQVSRAASLSLLAHKKTEMELRFLPAMSVQEIKEELLFRINRAGGRIEAFDLFDGLIHQKLIPVLLKKAGLSEHTYISKEDSLRELLLAITNCRVTLLKPREFEFCQVCAGGLRTDEIEADTLMSKLVPGLFFCGELLDVDGICGGYNLQWAWASGHTAGSAAAMLSHSGTDMGR